MWGKDKENRFDVEIRVISNKTVIRMHDSNGTEKIVIRKGEFDHVHVTLNGIYLGIVKHGTVKFANIRAMGVCLDRKVGIIDVRLVK